MRLPKDPQNIESTIESLSRSSEMTGVNLWVLVAAIFIASLGLTVNSTAVIIGAMLISPLMGPIMGLGLGLGINNVEILKKAARSFIYAVSLSIVTSVIFFLISPVKGAGSELLARTSPTLYDVLIAFVGGIAGIIAGSSALRQSNVVPGVAIATALMPPLCTVGYGIANLNFTFAAGAFYLFLINCVFICLATYLVVRLLNFPKTKDLENVNKKKWRMAISIFIFLLIIPSVYITYRVVTKYYFEKNVQEFIDKEVENADHYVVSSKIRYTDTKPRIELMLMGNEIDSAGKSNLVDKMKYYNLQNCNLMLLQGEEGKMVYKNQFEKLSSGLEFQKASASNLYKIADSLWTELNRIRVSDSVEIRLAKEVYKVDSTLENFKVQRDLTFNPLKNKYDTTWIVKTIFKNERSMVHPEVIDSVLKKVLYPGVIKVEYGVPF